VYELKRQSYLLVWAGGWLAVGLTSLSGVMESWLGQGPWAAALEQWLLAMAALLFLTAARLYGRATVRISSVLGVAALAGLWAVAYTKEWVSVSLYLGAALLLFAAARVFWQEGRKRESPSDFLLAASFVAWGLLDLGILLQPRSAWLNKLDLHLPLVVPQLFCGVLMVMAVYEEERHRIERNMLALSNLNLATSSFVGGEIQKMLAQALDRVLNVARIPSGALCLHYGDSQGPISVVTTGLTDDFSSTVLEENLEDSIVKLVARLGGLVVLRDLARDGTWRTLDREPSFKRIRELLLAQNLRTVVGISLQAKERVLGVLLLGTPDNRRCTPAELRLLLALGHQIGMAVENSYLVQQTSRRSEELHILNEIGRALSSTLEPDTLFRQIYEEIRRLLDVNSFYIAFYDQRTPQVRYEIKVLEGELQPKHTRPAGNHLIEYVVQARQPLLIRSHFQEETRKLGFEPIEKTGKIGSICAVPLILYDKPIGVMAVLSPVEHAFDEGHVELLRVLASEASIAIENA